MSDIFGDLAQNAAYVDAFSMALESIWAHGTRETLMLYFTIGADP